MEINIVHLYPDYLNLYGDRGNIAALCYRLEKRDINAVVTNIEGDGSLSLKDCDILFLGGGSDREQKIVCDKLLAHCDEIRNYIENGGVCIAVCGGYQLLGNFYQLKDETIEGLKILDTDTKRSDGKRLISNVILSCNIDGIDFKIAGFENHGGRTDIKNHTPLGKVVYGYGNNGVSGYEGVLYKNVFATYLHGPLLPKNPVLCDIILKRALKKKYGEDITLSPLDDEFENIAFKNVCLEIENISRN